MMVCIRWGDCGGHLLVPRSIEILKVFSLWLLLRNGESLASQWKGRGWSVLFVEEMMLGGGWLCPVYK